MSLKGKNNCRRSESNSNNKLGDQKYCKAVRYVTDFPRLNLDEVQFRRSITPGIGAAGLSKNAVDLNESNLQNVIYTKSSEWAYEEEWRFVAAKGGCEQDYPGMLREVIFGLRCSMEVRDQIRAAVLHGPHGQQVTFRQIDTQPNSFVLIAVPSNQHTTDVRSGDTK